ncbi:carboxylesterase/lipase family protein [Devosia rhizoryzae]|uniref:Carboxylic ester hydrolase n=1 Tax=Devosia rhizoryzae TaxID=2774137 RepID=A0ABX7C735_9HYPH|nr:carboxylesterase family protein [Devosia rhizoryzae]QQR40021.1 carboxylesterase family protein [Devosia rhizoryzae]
MTFQGAKILRTPAISRLALAMATTLAVSSAQAQVVNPIEPIKTNSGLVAGQVLEPGVKAWLGIPFAKPPTQDLRWQPPQPISWDGTWNADRLGPECIQDLRPHNINHYFAEEPTSENCLYMNVWAPEDATATSKLPVVVFIYGGGGTVGSSGIDTYAGQEIAKKDAIFVNFNYRVGILGFMAHPELSAEQDGHSGNYAYLDQNAALKWINENIEQFGGDPERVVIMGQSAGARAVTEQIYSPLSAGLFSGAVMSSGCTWDIAGTSLEDGEKTGLEVQAALGVDSLEAMRYVPADKILAIQNETQLGVSRSGIRTSGVIDGYFMPKSQAEIQQAGEMNDVPIIAHFNRDEASTPFSAAKTVAEYEALASELYGENAEAFLATFPVASDDEVADQTTAIALANRHAKNAVGCAAIQSEVNESPAFISMFSRKHTFGDFDYADIDEATVGAYHTADIPFWFGTLEAFNKFHNGRNWSDDDRALSNDMMDSLIAFASTGNPATEAVAWEPWSAENQMMMEFADSAELVSVNPEGIDWLAANPIPAAPAVPAPSRIEGVGPRD